MLLLLSRKVKDPLAADPSRPFDLRGAILFAVGLVLVVMGILAAQNNIWLMLGCSSPALSSCCGSSCRSARRSARTESRCFPPRCSVAVSRTSGS
jgi:hypothetical protein